MTIQNKLIISFLSLICLFVIADFIKIQAIQNTTENLNEVVSQSTPVVIILNEISASFARIREEAISGALIISALQNLPASSLRHGGSAWVQAREGGGSEFIITFRSTKKKPSNALLNE